MNATKRFLTGAAIAAGALGIGAGVFFACRQELSPGAHSGSAGAERRPAAAKYDDGDYDFYFKNGGHIHGDCDGYNSDPNGKTKIYEWSQSEAKKWRDRLRSVGIEPEIYLAGFFSNPKGKEGIYCWVQFDTNLLVGIGWEGRGLNLTKNDKIDVLTANGTKLCLDWTNGLHYAPAYESFGTGDENEYLINELSKAQKERNIPTIVFIKDSDKRFGDYDGSKTAGTLRKAGVTIIENGKKGSSSSYVIADARDIQWFAYNQ